MLRSTVLWIVFCISILFFGMDVQAQEAEYQNATFEVEGFGKVANLHDGNRNTYSQSEEGIVTVSNSEGIYSIYIEFDRLPKEWTLTNPDTGESVVCGQYSFLHEFVDVDALFEEVPAKLVMTFAAETVVADIYAFSQGELPDWVQIWQPPCEEADLLLLSSHSDDEQLFFAGILPYYAGEKGVKVQVAYVVQHFEVNGSKNHQRPHEQLDGLWTVGVKNYPVMSDFPDLYAESKDRETAFKQAEAVFESAGVTYDDFVSYITECLRRFKPLAVVSHDLDGEYGHGTHVLASAALTEAVTCAADEAQYPHSAAAYGTWEVEKLYLHLYEENQIQMNFDIPLEQFDGKTAFEVSQDGFGCHKSQHWTWFYKWMYGTEERPITQAADIKKYSPCIYGLFYTKVGNDVIGGDFLENVMTYEERELKAQQEAEALRLEEEARKAAEEAAKREEQERLEREAALQAQAQMAEAEEAAKPGAGLDSGLNNGIVVGIIAGILLVIGTITVLLWKKGHYE